MFRGTTAPVRIAPSKAKAQLEYVEVQTPPEGPPSQSLKAPTTGVFALHFPSSGLEWVFCELRYQVGVWLHEARDRGLSDYATLFAALPGKRGAAPVLDAMAGGFSFFELAGVSMSRL